MATVLGWVLPMLLGLAHLLVVSRHYSLGSFDDDANYMMSAVALASGHGLGAVLPSGSHLVSQYLPGYPLLLTPIVWLLGPVAWAARSVSALCMLALFPLLWLWTGRRGLSYWVRVGVLVLLALNPVVATYATMVMAEAPFCLSFVLLLLVLDLWETKQNWWTAALVVFLSAWLVWLKEAGIGLVFGLILILAWRRLWKRAVFLAVGVGVLLLPGVIARLALAVPTVGSRYASDLGSSGGGFFHQTLVTVPTDIWNYISLVLWQSVLTTGSPLPSTGIVSYLVTFIGFSVPLFCLIGAVTWWRRFRDVATIMVIVYFLETLAYPYNNERRVILVLPVVLVWYVLGAKVFVPWVVSVVRRRYRVLSSRLSTNTTAAVALLAVIVPTSTNFTRDYLYAVGQNSSDFPGSSAMALLRRLPPSTSLVETDYRSSVAYFSGHRTQNDAFLATTTFGPQSGGDVCTESVATKVLVQDKADYLVVGDVNKPDLMDSPCLLRLASTSSWAVRLLSSAHDQMSLFELVGPGTAQPDLKDLTADVIPTSTDASAAVSVPGDGQGDQPSLATKVVPEGGVATVAWSWNSESALKQVTVGSVAGAQISSVSVKIHGPSGWKTLRMASGSVGDGGAVPYLLSLPPADTEADAVAVSVHSNSAVTISNVHVIGESRPKA